MTIFISKFEHKLTGCQRLTDVASLYFRNVVKKRVSKQLFIEQINRDTELHSRLLAQGFSPDNQYLMPNHLSMIVERWGFPDAVSKWQTQKTITKDM